MNLGIHSYRQIEGKTFSEIAQTADRDSMLSFSKWEIVGIKNDDDEKMVVLHNILEELARLASLHETDAEREKIAYFGTQLGLFYKNKKEIEGFGSFSLSN